MELQEINSMFSTINPESHINHLPVELLQQIFSLIVHDWNTSDYHPSIFPLKYNANYSISAIFMAPPLLFTQVCRFWRVVACLTTRLWSRIPDILSGGITNPLMPLLAEVPYLLQFWLACSGDHPLTLHIDSRPFAVECGRRFQSFTHLEVNSRLLEILLAESGRWETVTLMSFEECEVNMDTLDTPQLRTLECDIYDLKRFHAPNLSCLHVRGFSFISQDAIPLKPTPTTTNIQHLHLDYTSVHVICSTAVIFPRLKTFAVDWIFLGSERDIVTRSRLDIESMTLPVSPLIDIRAKLIAIFKYLHLPVLQKLILVSKPGSIQVAYVKAALVAGSCFPRVIDFQTIIPLGEVDVGIVESLLEVVEEVTVRGEVVCCRASCTSKTSLQLV